MNVNDAMETAAAYLAAHEQEQEPLFDSEEVAITLAKEVERLLAVNQIFEAANVRLATELERVQAELAQFRKDWCEDDEAIKQQALRVLDAAKVEGDSVYVPRMGALAEMMADEIERLRIWNKRWRDISARLRLTLAELINEDMKLNY